MSELGGGSTPHPEVFMGLLHLKPFDFSKCFIFFWGGGGGVMG